jgi:hypothetical protein
MPAGEEENSVGNRCEEGTLHRKLLPRCKFSDSAGITNFLSGKIKEMRKKEG